MVVAGFIGSALGMVMEMGRCLGWEEGVSSVGVGV